jgi:hypothetical protein
MFKVYIGSLVVRTTNKLDPKNLFQLLGSGQQLMFWTVRVKIRCSRLHTSIVPIVEHVFKCPKWPCERKYL